MRALLTGVIGAMFASAPVSVAADTVYVFPDNPLNRATLAALANTRGIELAAATAGDTLVVNMRGNGFERGLMVDGLRAQERKAFNFSAAGLATPTGAAALEIALDRAGYTTPVIVVVPRPEFPDKCIFAECLPDDWFAMGGEKEGDGGTSTDVGEGYFGNGTGIGGARGPGHSGGFLGGSGTSVGGGYLPFGSVAGGGGAINVGNGFTINGLKVPAAGDGTSSGGG